VGHVHARTLAQLRQFGDLGLEIDEGIQEIERIAQAMLLSGAKR
jgi:hypothetical protein